MVFSMSAVITPLCLPQIAKEFHLNQSSSGILEMTRTYVLALVLVIAALLAHRYGKKRFVIGGQYLLAAGLWLCSLAPSYGALIIGLVVIGIGWGGVEALVNP